jgi:hypothetical protein
VRGFGVLEAVMHDVRKGWRWRGFAVLCLIASSRWILEDAWPAVGSSLRSEAWACAVLAVLTFAGALGLRRQRPALESGLTLLAVGGGVLAAPSFGVVLGGAAGDSFNRTVALCFVPVIVIVLSGIWSDGAFSPSFWPGLAGLGGALLVFPLVLPSSVVGYVGLLAPAIVVGAACVACRRVARGVPGEWSAALLFTGGAVCLGLLEARHAAPIDGALPFPFAAVGIDIVLTALTVFVVLRTDAMRYAARYFVVPLLTIVEGLLVLREGVTLRLGAGIALLAVAAAALLTTRRDGDRSSSLGLT